MQLPLLLTLLLTVALLLSPSEELDFFKPKLYLNHSGLVFKADVTQVLRRVDPRFLSLTVDASLASDEKFMSLLSSEKVRVLARALTPAFLRFGGTRQDFMVFTPQTHRRWRSAAGVSAECEDPGLPLWLEESLKKQWLQQQILLKKEDLQRKYKKVKFTETTVDQLYSFTNCSGLELIFGLNALLRTSNNSWNSSNAEALLHYCGARHYDMSWELGNEPNSFEKKAGIRVDGVQLGEDFLHLRKLLMESRFYHKSRLFGPDVGQPRDHRVDLLDGFLETGAEAIDACTWHHYYVNGRDTSLKDFLDPEILDSFILKTNEVLEKVKLAAPDKSVWLGETSSAYGGGAVGLSDTFVAGFMWLDKLGLGARLGLDVIMRQVFIGSGNYHLIDDNLDPLPDYWLSVLYKRLVGPEVLLLKKFPSFTTFHKRVRLYMHCTNKKSFEQGAVTLIAMNLNHEAVRVSVPEHMASSTVQAFVLQSEPSGSQGLVSRTVRLNGEVLKMVDDTTLPDLHGAALPPSQHLHLGPYSLSFYVFTDLRAPACLSL